LTDHSGTADVAIIAIIAIVAGVAGVVPFREDACGEWETELGVEDERLGREERGVVLRHQLD
jgi:hypothetical protein